MMPLLRDWDFDALITHNRFTLINRNAEGMIDYAHSRNIAVLNAAPYASGVLAKGTSSYKRYVYQEASEEMLDPIRGSNPFAQGTAFRPAQPHCSFPCAILGSPPRSAASAGPSASRRRLNGRVGQSRMPPGRN